MTWEAGIYYGSSRPQQACHPRAGLWAKAWDLCLVRPSIRFLLLNRLLLIPLLPTCLRWNDIEGWGNDMGGWRLPWFMQASAGMSSPRWLVGKGLGSMPGEAVL